MYMGYIETIQWSGALVNVGLLKDQLQSHLVELLGLELSAMAVHTKHWPHPRSRPLEKTLPTVALSHITAGQSTEPFQWDEGIFRKVAKKLRQSC